MTVFSETEGGSECMTPKGVGPSTHLTTRGVLYFSWVLWMVGWFDVLIHFHLGTHGSVVLTQDVSGCLT